MDPHVKPTCGALAKASSLAPQHGRLLLNPRVPFAAVVPGATFMQVFILYSVSGLKTKHLLKTQGIVTDVRDVRGQVGQDYDKTIPEN